MNFHGSTSVSFDLSASKKRTLRKLYLALALISAATFQTACSATISGSGSTSASTPDAVPVDAATGASPAATTAPTDHATDGTSDDFGSVIPPLGTFDRLDPDFIRYQPCLEMPDEFLAEAGLHGKEMMDDVGEVDGICTFKTPSEYGATFFNLQGSSHSFTDYERILGETWSSETSNGEQILNYRPEYLSDRESLTSIETQQGTLSITFQSFKYGHEDPNLNICETAENKLKTVLELDGKHEN